MVFGGLFSVFSTRPRAAPEPSIPYLGFVRLAPPFDSYVAELPADVTVPSMMSLPEKQFLYHLARDYYAGEGYIVDAGIFLGASTYCFGAGVRDNPNSAAIVANRPKPVISIEKGIVNPTMIRAMRHHGMGADLAAGDSFAPVVEKNVAPVRQFIRLRFGDILEQGRAVGTTEILFLDVIKHPTTGHFAVEHFFPKLIAGRSIVIQQDYLFDGLEYLKPYQEFFADKFDYIGEIASSAVYRCTDAITSQDIRRFRDGMEDAALQLKLAEFAIGRTQDPARQIMMTVSLLRLAISLKGVEAGKPILAEMEEKFAATLADPVLPKRVHDVVSAAHFLCSSKGEKRDLIHAQMIALGHAPAGDAAAG